MARSHALIRGGTTEGQALLWNAGLDGRNRILWHGDGTFGQTSQMVLYPDRQSGFVLLVNDACPGSETALLAIAKSVQRALEADATRCAPVSSDRER